MEMWLIKVSSSGTFAPISHHLPLKLWTEKFIESITEVAFHKSGISSLFLPRRTVVSVTFFSNFRSELMVFYSSFKENWVYV